MKIVRKAFLVFMLAALLLDPWAASGELRMDLITRSGWMQCWGTVPGWFYTLESAQHPGGPWGADSFDVTDIQASAVNMMLLAPSTARQRFYRVAGGLAPYRMATVPGGVFDMGDEHSSGDPDELPAHPVDVSAFAIDRYEVTNGQMADMIQWAFKRGKVSVKEGAGGVLTVENTEGDGQTLIYLSMPECRIGWIGHPLRVFTVASAYRDHPVVGITWYGAAAYCNYKSDVQGLDRCFDFLDWSCDFSRDGYRLPTEAEWEKAARGGLPGQYYPWPSQGGVCEDHVDGSLANYAGSGDPWEADQYVSPVGYYDGGQAPVGTDMANGYGLYDMAGNVEEWCWDQYSSGWYRQPEALQKDTTGPPPMGSDRVVRGGSAADSDVADLRCANREFNPRNLPDDCLGFRCVRRP